MEQYEWDEEKNRLNRAKHGVGFELVYEFDWSGAHYRSDRRQDYGEPRRLAYGWADSQSFAIVFVVRAGRIRVISVRRMHAKERRKYGLETPP